MRAYFLRNLSELAEKRAIIMRQEAQLWDILARDLKREAGRIEEAPARRLVREPLAAAPNMTPGPEEGRLLVRIPEAIRMMGIGRSSLYKEINAGTIKVRKSGRKTLVALSDIQAWYASLPEACAGSAIFLFITTALILPDGFLDRITVGFGI